jgi:hypothetical protein
MKVNNQFIKMKYKIIFLLVISIALEAKKKTKHSKKKK